MFLRKSLLAVAALSLAAAPAFAQQRPDPVEQAKTAVYDDTGGTHSDLLLILGAIVGAGLLTFLVTQLNDDKPVSP